MKKLTFSISLLALFFTLISAQGEEQVKTRLIANVKSINPGVPFLVGIRLEMKKDWHTYWENPGDAGLETKVKWTLPDGFKVSRLKWPYPEIIMMSGLVDYGYENEIMLIAEIIPQKDLKTGEQVNIKADISYLVCKSVCLPGKSSNIINLIVNSGKDEFDAENLPVFDKYMQKIPSGNPASSLNIKDDTLFVSVSLDKAGDFSESRFFPLKPGIIKNQFRQRYSTGKSGIIFSLPKDEYLQEDPDTLKGVLLTGKKNNGIRFEKAYKITAVSGAKNVINNAGQNNTPGLFLSLVFAFLGGIILNLMPCVLPVLSIKVLSFIGNKDKSKKQIIFHGWLYTAGVILSFLFLSGLLIFLRFSGEQIGWGFQLQSPLFLTVMIIVIFLFALNLFGVFETGNSFVKLGSKFGQSDNKLGSFSGGVAAVLLATPCTAPLMGSAIGFAITQPPVSTLTVFFFLGMGMAFPYLFVSYFPEWLKFIPKPGLWMEHLKQFLGFLLAGTVIWLVWVLSLQQGINSVIMILISLLIASVAAWIYGNWGNLSVKPGKRTVSIIVSLALIIMSVYIALPSDGNSKIKTNPETDGNFWEKYSAEKVSNYVNSGKNVFIDFTAAWCLTCQVNKQTSLDTDAARKLFEDNEIIPLVADWTSQNEEITKALASFGRNSVPLYVLYSGKTGKPVLLPEILTPDILEDHIKNVITIKKEGL